MAFRCMLRTDVIRGFSCLYVEEERAIGARVFLLNKIDGSLDETPDGVVALRMGGSGFGMEP